MGTRALLVASAFLLAAAGVVWYAVAPGVGTFQASGWLTAPALVMVLVWLHRRLPLWLQWTLAVPLAALGSIGYLVWGGDQWWNWGQLTPLPLIALVMRDSFRDEEDEEEDGSRTATANYGGIVDGPWGPP